MNCQTHERHDHKHGPGCGHQAIQHENHVDYVHDGHLHYMHNDHIDEHMLEGGTNQCTPNHSCAGHDKAHMHGANCGHTLVPHEGHIDYLVSGHLHHPCADHCDNHGPVTIHS